MSVASDPIRRLWKERPRSGFVRASLLLFVVILGGAWIHVGADLSILWSDATTTYLDTFLSRDVRPKPLRGTDWDWGVFGEWLNGIMSDTGWRAASATLAISVLAIVLAAFGSMFLSFPAARTFATPEPFAPAGRPPARLRRFAWRACVAGTRTVLILMRSLPEYLLAFLLLSVLGRSAWPAVLALAIHNMGILGRLNAEVIENLPSRSLRALRAGGASRAQIAAVGVLPAALPRFLLYFFYRWETCVREATVLGMLGLAGLGYYISEEMAHYREDRLIVFVLLGSAIVVLGDVISAIARRLVRDA